MVSFASFRCLYENLVLTFYLLVNRKFNANYFNKLWEGMNVNISNEFIFSEVHGSMN